HQRARVAIEARIVGVSDYPNDLAGRLFKLWANAFADDDLLTDGAALGPILFRHGFIDDDDASGPGRVLRGEVAALKQRNLEDGEIAGRDAHPAASAGVGAF